jgi:uncharacterized protein YjbI with pentapeptide repeats
VYWLAERVRRPSFVDSPNVWDLHLEGAILNEAHLEGADLRYAHLDRASLLWAHLTEADLGGAVLWQAGLSFAHLEGANLSEASPGANWGVGANLERAFLGEAHLERANLSGAQLDRASLSGAQLEGTDLSKAHLEGADLQRVTVDNKTNLAEAVLDKRTHLGDIHWGSLGGVDLTQISWSGVTRLGEETSLRAEWQWLDDPTLSTHARAYSRDLKTGIYESAIRAYRQLATQLRAQGMSEPADRFLYRAQVCQRRVDLRRFRLPQYLGSLFLDLISGYGYKPVRSFITYILVILGFAAAYFALGGANRQTLSWNEAIVISMTAFHGRGFFSSVFQPGDVQAAVAAVEAFIGLLIEIVLIATFTQRFFAR